MAKTLIVSSGTPEGVAAGATEYIECATTAVGPGRATESNAQVVWRSAGTFSKLYVYVTANATTSGTSTIRLSINGVQGNLVVSIPSGAGSIGVFEDTSHTDAITAGAKVTYKCTCAAGGAITIGTLSVIFDATTNTVSKLGVQGSPSYATASVSRFNPIVGEGTSAVAAEASAQTKFMTAGTLRNLEAYVTTNARTTQTTIRVRKNGADGNQFINIAGGAANQGFEDTTRTDTIAAGDLLDFAVVTGTGTESLLITHITAEFVTTDGTGYISYGRAGGFVQSEPATTFPYIGGSAIIGSTGTEANTQVKTRETFTFSQMTISVTANTVNAESTLTFRKNGADGNQVVPIPSTGTGFITDTTHADVCTATDLVNMELVTPAVAGSQTLTARTFSLLTNLTTSVSQTSIHKYDIIEEALTPISQSSIHTYNLLVNISQASIQKYNLLRYITQNSIHKYQILVNILQASIQKYNLLAYISQSSIQKYNLLRYITQASIQKYNSLANVLQSSIHKYSLLQNILQSSIQKYNIIQNILQSSIHKYNSLQNILQNTIHKYDIIALGAVIQSTIQKYNILVYVNQTSVQKYHILQDILQTSIQKYNSLENILQTSIHKYNLETLGAVIANTIQKYDIRQYVTQESMQKYYILNYIFAESMHTYNILQYILQESIHKYDILPTIGQVMQTTIHKYNIAKYVLRTSIHKYSIGSLKRQLKSLYPGTGGIETSKGSRLLQNLLKELWPN